MLVATMCRLSRRLAMAVAIASVVAVLALLALVLLRAPRQERLPNPNGYDYFVKAGKAVAGKVSDFGSLDHDSLRDLVSSNAEPLRLLRLGLTCQCAIPFNEAVTNMGSMPLMSVRTLAQLLAAQGRLKEIEDRTGEAAAKYTEVIHFGQEASRGGVVITRLVGIACEAIGSFSLVRLAPKLACPQARPIISDLERIDAHGVSWVEIRERERAFVWHELRTVRNPLEWIRQWWDARTVDAQAELTHRMASARLRLLAVELALRCYQSEHGRAPAKLDELVPAYLKHVPLDPFNGQPVIYRPQGEDWLLYSVGPDGVDDGGKRAGRGVSNKGDTFFDSR